MDKKAKTKPATWLFGNRKMHTVNNLTTRRFNIGEVVVFTNRGRDYIGTILEDAGKDWVVLDRRNKRCFAWKGATRPLHGNFKIS